jgi:hypothetical protein
MRKDGLDAPDVVLNSSTTPYFIRGALAVATDLLRETGGRVQRPTPYNVILPPLLYSAPKLMSNPNLQSLSRGYVGSCFT